MSVAIIIVVFLAFLLVSLFFHELGHFIAARRARVKVEEFGIGLPPRLFGIKRGETVYSVNAIPLGAFVKAAGEDDPSVPRSLAGTGPWTRLGVYVAGPVVNVLLAFVLLSVFLSLPVGTIAGDGLMVHSVGENSPADEAGITAGDVIYEVEGQSVRRWDDMREIVNSVEEGAAVTLIVDRDGQGLEMSLIPKFEPELQRRVIGVVLCWNIVTDVEGDTPADEADIRPGDTVISINSRPVYSDASMRDVLISLAEGQELEILLLRDAEPIVRSLLYTGEKDLQGAEVKWVPGIQVEEERLPIWRAAYLAAGYIVYMPALIVDAIPFIRESPDRALVGPIGAGQLTVEVVRSSGFSSILFMAGMISLGIGMFNLLPIPPLDGGGMLVAFIEGCRRGKRLSPRTVRLAYTIGTAFLIALVVLITFVDIWRLPRGFGL
jgi:regulator of sigma E protease